MTLIKAGERLKNLKTALLRNPSKLPSPNIYLVFFFKCDFLYRETEAEPEAAPVEEEPKELTLDEWKAQRGVRTKPTYNIRKAGEGEDPSQWKKMYELNKKKDGDEEVLYFFFTT